MPPKSQQAILEQLPAQIAGSIIELSNTLDDELSEDDWDYFYNSWPEFAGLIDHVKTETKNSKINDLMSSERTKVKDFLQYHLGLKKERTNISKSLAKIISKQVLEV